MTSWGRCLSAEQSVLWHLDRLAPIPPLLASAQTFLPYGNGRSYGDSCLNAGGVALKTGMMDRLIAFDVHSGVLRCDAGILLAEILRLFVAQGWFLPVTPGTRFVTVGGAIANDVHGKNHHVTGTFGCHVRQFELLRSDGQRLRCSPNENADYYAATIGGLGLTGLITWVELQLRRIGNPWLAVETIRYESLTEFFALCETSDRDYEYTVSWVDCSGQGRRLGRGLFMRGNHAPLGVIPGKHTASTRTFPFVPPVSLVNAVTLKAFNSV
ncbi:MAG: FAD-binding oxidoreductase, partial [Methylococcaceae bacterium]|nr:FAD-binding oxidoreductase [Methylococcaceae bacterium]